MHISDAILSYSGIDIFIRMIKMKIGGLLPYVIFIIFIIVEVGNLELNLRCNFRIFSQCLMW
jgi:hypothetical protein